MTDGMAFDIFDDVENVSDVTNDMADDMAKCVVANFIVIICLKAHILARPILMLSPTNLDLAHFLRPN